MALTTLPLLDAAEAASLRALLATAQWQDGRATAGAQAVRVKNNQQLAPACDAARKAGAVIRAALDRNPRLLSAALPRKVFPPHFNRYGGDANRYGPHVDGAVRLAPGGERVRTDLSCTVFLSDPQDYDGGELLISEGDSRRSVKLAAGHAVLYPGTHVHEVTPVTRGERLACFFWIESMVRSSEQRRLLFEFDEALMALRAQGESNITVTMAGTYHNLLRMWADT
ncbi:MAG: Fe2+-dependent dioxygenase [Pseudomonadota bacterium]